MSGCHFPASPAHLLLAIAALAPVLGRDALALAVARRAAGLKNDIYLKLALFMFREFMPFQTKCFC